MKTQELMQKFIDAHFDQFDFTIIQDAWGRPIFKHSHIRSRYEGWILGQDESAGRIAELQKSNKAVLDENRKLKAALERKQEPIDIEGMRKEVLGDGEIWFKNIGYNQAIDDLNDKGYRDHYEEIQALKSGEWVLIPVDFLHRITDLPYPYEEESRSAKAMIAARPNVEGKSCG